MSFETWNIRMKSINAHEIKPPLVQQNVNNQGKDFLLLPHEKIYNYLLYKNNIQVLRKDSDLSKLNFIV